jgi:hypothetical protein
LASSSTIVSIEYLIRSLNSIQIKGLNESFRIGLEFAWRETEYKTLRDNDGGSVHTQFQWTF